MTIKVLHEEDFFYMDTIRVEQFKQHPMIIDRWELQDDGYVHRPLFTNVFLEEETFNCLSSDL